MNCPFCKSPRSEKQSFANVTDYDCGSSDYGPTQGWSRSDICYQNQLEQYEELLQRALTALLQADSLFVRCFEWSKGEASISVPVQKLGLDIADWGRRWALIDDELEAALKERP